MIKLGYGNLNHRISSTWCTKTWDLYHLFREDYISNCRERCEHLEYMSRLAKDEDELMRFREEYRQILEYERLIAFIKFLEFFGEKAENAIKMHWFDIERIVLVEIRFYWTRPDDFPLPFCPEAIVWTSFNFVRRVMDLDSQRPHLRMTRDLPEDEKKTEPQTGAHEEENSPKRRKTSKD